VTPWQEVVPLRRPGQAVVQAVAKDADGVAGLVYRSSRPSVPSFLASGPSRVRGMFVPRSRALAQSSIRDLLKKRNRPQRLKEVHIDSAAVLRDLTLVIGHGFLLIAANALASGGLNGEWPGQS